MISGASMGSFNPHFILSRCHLLSHERACNSRFPPNAIKMSSINATEACVEGCLKIYSRAFFFFPLDGCIINHDSNTGSLSGLKI